MKILYVIFLTNSLLLLSYPVLGQPVTDNQEKLFEEIFGKPRNQNLQSVFVPFFIDGKLQGQTIIFLKPGSFSTIRIQASPVLKEIKNYIDSENLQKLASSIDSEGYLPLEILQKNGIEVQFSEQKLELQIQIPFTLRKTKVSRIQNQTLPPEAVNALHPSKLSGYINLRGGQDFIWSGNQTTSLEPQALRLQLDGAVNVNGWVIEGSSNFTEGADTPFVRGNFRLIKDNPSSAVRYAFGDVVPPTTGFQQNIALLGVSVAKNFALQPYKITRPINNYEFFLERASKIQVFVNSRLVKTLQLPAGKQDIRDLPLSLGANDIQLVITDNVGHVSQLNFSSAMANDLLAPGLQKFAYSFGFPSSTKNGIHTYDLQEPMLSLSHHWGVSNNLTIGGYLQGTSKHRLVGLEGIWATSLGNLGWDVALSNTNNAGNDYAAKLRYDFLKIGSNNSSQAKFNVELEHRSINFSNTGEDTSQNEYSLGISTNYSQKILDNINANLSFRYQFGRGSIPDAHAINLGLSKYIANGLGVNLNFNQSYSHNGNDEKRFHVSLSWLKQMPYQSLRTTSEIQNQGIFSHRLNWNYNPSAQFGSLRGSLEAVQKSNNFQVTGQLSYPGYRGNVDISQEFSRVDQNISNVTRLSFGTALVFAEGHFGWSRPVNNSFALLIPHSNIRGRVLGINPGGNGYFARIDDFGSGVVPNLQAYNISNIKLDSSNLPIGYDLGKESYQVLPSYKSGTLIHVGTDATIFLKGRLIYKDGKAVSLKSGKIVSLSDSNWRHITFFTNKIGKFAVAGLKPGRYEVRLIDDSQQMTSFEISDTTGLYDIGDLILSQ